MAFEFEENVEEKKDWTKAIWAGIVALFAVMIAGMVLFSSTKPAQSLVVVKHILISCDPKDVADRTRAIELAKELRQRLQNGESFAKLAKEYSGDPTTARNGGLLTPTARGAFEKNFEDYAWTAPIGQLSEPIATGYGFHLIEVVNRHIHETELYEADLDRRASELLRQKSKEKSASSPASAPATPEPAPAPVPEQPAAPAPAPVTEQPAAPAPPAAQ